MFPPRNAAAVIATHGRPTLLRRTLESLGASDDPGVPFEIVVVENGAPAGAGAVCRELALPYPLRYRHVAEPGKSRALNVALAEIDAEFLIFTDDDIRAAPGMVRALIGAAGRHGPGHFFGGPVYADHEEPPPAWLARYLPKSATGWSIGDAEQIRDTPDFLGANWAAYRRELQAVGGFTTYLGPHAVRGMIGGEETEIQRRLLAHGARGVYVPGAEVWHFVPRARCTVAWALDRQTRLQAGYALERGSAGPGVSIAGVPLWLWKQVAVDVTRVAGQRVLRREWPSRIEAEIQLAIDRGRLRGYRLLHRQQREALTGR